MHPGLRLLCFLFPSMQALGISYVVVFMALSHSTAYEFSRISGIYLFSFPLVILLHAMLIAFVSVSLIGWKGGPIGLYRRTMFLH
ncbi:hypothetical protein J3E72DRAFT_349522 [Bipolaris maydis]|uniref:uncharacterized protein n=1 Tax=Cochliobolus heterostrophus TaxID=5016 RepID=UPI0024D974A4|nr:hypothetical protein J3E73DRAFT_321930 [Bipolaris maydis]KAJ5033134.1 hypothetical protein J3E74DRAFT_399695 [Bipolaris maydis]KAJ5056930.1 hypothetical protein J3E74DRAFT_368171 [Bipolaris maydis]KAJ6194532.1 hypothetical protein J3E72DRAFT_349522 [Bipolaris maydis]KAJ6212417.1 hypothetical protein PSV09DRAFT_2287367 [Bipolaris maydis]